MDARMMTVCISKSKIRLPHPIPLIWEGTGKPCGQIMSVDENGIASVKLNKRLPKKLKEMLKGKTGGVITGL